MRPQSVDPQGGSVQCKGNPLWNWASVISPLTLFSHWCINAKYCLQQQQQQQHWQTFHHLNSSFDKTAVFGSILVNLFSSSCVLKSHQLLLPGLFLGFLEHLGTQSPLQIIPPITPRKMIDYGIPKKQTNKLRLFFFKKSCLLEVDKMTKIAEL